MNKFEQEIYVEDLLKHGISFVLKKHLPNFETTFVPNQDVTRFGMIFVQKQNISRFGTYFVPK